MRTDLMRPTLRLAVVVGSLASLSACEWFTDFKRQPSVVTWEQLDSAGVRGSPQYSVPITGTAMPGFAVSYSNSMQTIDSMSALVNPTPPDSASLANGRKYFVINCAVCHGMAGKGDGTAVKYGVFPFPLVSGPALSRTDGYIFGMIRNGRGNMPPYNRIEEKDRWDVVNYVRGLQGKLPAAVPTGPLAVPGFNGPAVPGPGGRSRHAPERRGPLLHVPPSGSHNRPAEGSLRAPARARPQRRARGSQPLQIS